MGKLLVKLPPELNKRLNAYIRESKGEKSECIVEALEAFLDEYADVLLATSKWKRVKRGESKLTPFDEIEKELGLKEDKADLLLAEEVSQRLRKNP